jgi:hypothetical protein
MGMPTSRSAHGRPAPRAAARPQERPQQRTFSSFLVRTGELIVLVVVTLTILLVCLGVVAALGILIYTKTR